MIDGDAIGFVHENRMAESAQIFDYFPESGNAIAALLRPFVDERRLNIGIIALRNRP